MRRIEVDVPAETYDRIRAYAKASGANTSQAAVFIILTGFQVLAGVAEGAQDAREAGKAAGKDAA
ncbi:hypothetical protein BJF79_22770 [Actinomadura sp. CNU-125]|nr:hypothetical protein BJF79_22770 [Actinomadura sp. CNU-125]